MISNRCPHCHGLLISDWDGQGEYRVCAMCAREFDLKGNPRRIPQLQFYGLGV